MKPEDRLIVALDFDSERKILESVKTLSGLVTLFKIGIGPFTACGPGIIDKIGRCGGKVFLDLKFHDIPDTVAKAVAAAVRPGVFMLNVHALGGPDMMEHLKAIAARRAMDLGIDRPKVLAVTILTSFDQKALNRVGIRDKIRKAVVRLAELAKKSGLDGVIASPHEVAVLKKTFGGDFLIVTPGVRPEWAKAYDQKRVETPREALLAGADYIVVGRPITIAANPRVAAERILEEMRIE